MGTNNDYSVLLKAKLDTSEIAKDIAKIQGEINKSASVTVKGQSSGVAKKIQEEIKNTSFKISPEIDKAKLEKALADITANAGKLEKMKIVSGLDSKGVEQMRSATITYSDAVGKVRSEYLMLNPAIKGTITSTQNLAKESQKFTSSFGQEMSAVIRRTLESASTLGIMYAALNQIRQGIQYIKDLDKELTNAQVVTGMSEEAVQSLGLEYNNLAEQMGVTTLEIAKGNLEWLRQGKTAEEAGELVKSSMVLSKLGNLDAAQSTEYLTSMMNGFKLEAEDSMGVIDKVISLDNSFATSAGEISSALQRSSVSAQQAGVSFEELASMITVVSSVSRRAPESIGESFKTMFARYQDILAGGVDEEGMGINNVGKALERVGINIRDAEGGFRDFSDVLDDLYPKWEAIGEVEQAN